MSNHEVNEHLSSVEFDLDHFELSILDGYINVCQDKTNQLLVSEAKSIEISWEDSLDVWNEEMAKSNQNSSQEQTVDMLG